MSRSSSGSWSRGRPWRRQCLTALACLGTALVALASDSPRAPDGRRGFGPQTPVNDVLSVVRSNAEPERSFVHELDSLASEIKVLAALTKQQYDQAKYFDLLAFDEEHSLDLLHARFAELDEAPLPTLAAGGPKARALAAMLLDTRFRVRAAILSDCELDLRELERGLAVLRAATDGYVVLSQNESTNVVTRIDVAASVLRAVRNDLRALREQTASSDVDPALVDRILEDAGASEGEGVRRAAVLRERDASRRLEAMMSSALFTSRLRAQIVDLLEWRVRLLAEAQEQVAKAERTLPEADANKPPPAELAGMSKSERIRKAGFVALQAAQSDPLDERAVWIVGHSSEFLYGMLESRPWFDRYLALRRIRSHDHRTYAERKLSPRELEALEVVQRELLPGQPRQRGL